MASIADAFRGLSPEDLQRLLDMVDAYTSSGEVETVTVGALSLNTVVSFIEVDGTKAYTLADGLREGQVKKVRVELAANTPNGTLTPDNFVNGTSVDLDAVNEYIELVWTADGWVYTVLLGTTVTP